MMKLKKYLIWGLLSLFMVSLSSCFDDDKDLGSSSDLVGNWELISSHYYIKINGQIIDEERDFDLGDVIRFNSDGTIYEDGDVAQWSYEGGQIRLEYDGEVNYVPVKSLTSSRLEIEFTEKGTEDGATYEYYENMVYKKISD